MYYDENFLNAVQLVSFIVGIANYQENLTQSDKDDIMKGLDQQTKDILEKVQEALEEQNKMLKKIIEMIQRPEDERK